MKKRLFSLLLSACVLLGCLPVVASAAESWQFGSQTWTLNGGTLTISGTGIVEKPSPGHEFFQRKNEIQRLVIEPGITEIGYGALSELESLKQATLPDGLIRIGSLAFNNCTALEELNIPDSVTSFDRASIWNCHSLKSIQLPPPSGCWTTGSFITAWAWNPLSCPMA